MAAISCGDFKTSYAKDMAIFDSAFARWSLAVFLLALLTVPFYASSYWLDVANRVGIAIIGGLLIGILENLAGGYLDPLVGGGVKEVAPFVILVAILMIKPYGLFGKVHIERV